MLRRETVAEKEDRVNWTKLEEFEPQELRDLKCRYVVSQYDYGIALLSHRGIPIHDVSVAYKLLEGDPEKMVIAPGVAKYLSNNEGFRSVLAIAKSKEYEKRWEREIADSMKDYACPFVAWAKMGLDVGLSACTMLRACGDEKLVNAVSKFLYTDDATPRDASDFGRCMRMVMAYSHVLEKRSMPYEFYSVFGDAEKYPLSCRGTWKKLIQNWEELWHLGMKAGLYQRDGDIDREVFNQLTERIEELDAEEQDERFVVL